MNNLINKNNLSTILCITKISIIIFVGVFIYMNLPKYTSDSNVINDDVFSLYFAIFFLIVIGIMTIISFMSNKNVSQSSNVLKISWLIENIFFMVVISLPVYLFTTYESECRYLFLLLIICSVIEYGSSYGIITSLLSSVFILVPDLLYAPLENQINIYLQKDLVMTAVFIFVAWILGYYVDMEIQNSKKKDDTLNTLSIELEEKDKQRKEMELLLLNNKICYDMLFENSLNAIIVHKDGRIIYANVSARKLLGYQEQVDLKGKSIYSHYSEKLELDIREKYFDITNNKLLKVVREENILNCTGKCISVRNTSSFFTYKGEASVMTFLLDITSEKKVESLKEDIAQKLKLLNETREFNSLITNFFTNMSHELKTPVNVIYAAIQTINIYLDDFNLDSVMKRKNYLKIMKQNCLRMIRLINNLLDITKLDSGFIKVNKVNGDIVSITEDIVQSVASYVKSKGIELIFDTDIEEKVMGFDPNKIERILLNLISNALKYSNPNGHIYVTLIDKNSSIFIKVKDEGEGIPKDKISVIFERFGQVNSSLSRQCEGTGIGLYLVKAFVEMHNGKISVISKEGKGSEFIIELPTDLVINEECIDKVFYKTQVDRIEVEFSDIYSI